MRIKFSRTANNGLTNINYRYPHTGFNYLLNGATSPEHKQQNAATAEESASASEELNAQAEEFKGFVVDLSEMVGGSAAVATDIRSVICQTTVLRVGLTSGKTPAADKKPVKRSPLALQLP